MIVPPFTPRARRELVQAAAWIAEHNEVAALALVDAALSAAERLLAQPGLGRWRPGVTSDRHRFYAIRGFPYLLVCEAERQPIVIARLIHQSRGLDTTLDVTDD